MTFLNILLVLAVILMSSVTQASDLVIQSSKMSTISRIAISHNGSYVATFGQGGKLRIWDASSGMLLDETHMGLGSYDACKAIGFSDDGKYVYSYSPLGSIVRNWQERKTNYVKEQCGDTFAVAVDSAQMRFYVVDKNQLFIHSLDTGTLLSRHDIAEKNQLKIAQINLTKTGHLLLFCRNTGIIRYDPKSHIVTDHLKTNYPTKRLYDEKFVLTMPERMQEEARSFTVIDGVASWIPNKSGEKILLGFYSNNEKWVKVTEQGKESITEPLIFDTSENEVTWFGVTGKIAAYSSKSRNISILDLNKNEYQKIISPTFSRDVIVTSIDCDQEGKTIVIATDAGWICYENEDGNLLTWKERNYKSIPTERKVSDICPSSNRLLYGTQAGKAMAVNFNSKLENVVCGSLKNEIILVKSFRNGKLVVATANEYYLLQDDKLQKLCNGGFFPVIERCGRHILLDNTTVNGFVPNYKIIDEKGHETNQISFKNTRPQFHSHLPSFMATYSEPGEDSRIQMFKLSEKGECELAHEITIDGGLVVEAIPERSDSFLAFDYHNLTRNPKLDNFWLGSAGFCR